MAGNEATSERVASIKGTIFGLSCITDMVKQHRLVDDESFKKSHFQTALDKLQRVATASDHASETDERLEDGGYGEKPCEGFYRSHDIPVIFICGQKAAELLKAEAGGKAQGISEGENRETPGGEGDSTGSKVLFLNKRVEELAMEKWGLEQQIEWLTEKNRRLRSMLDPEDW